MSAPVSRELLLCPFCGGEARLYSPTYPMSADCDDAFVACGSCDAHGPTSLCDMADEDAEHHWPDACAEAITAWNTRHEATAPLIEALERIGGVSGPYGFPFPESSPDYPAFAVMEARAALASITDAKNT